ncbi:MAG: SGNH/GDSL hydrolase family protein [Planctomycetes bacterium]|nr:SGNH/GDSL hydrolase family protein [Planctomycetota bacterium]
MEPAPRRRRGGVKLLALLLSVVFAVVLAEVCARVWVVYLADEATFLRYASFDQLTARFGGPQFQAHRHLGYLPTPGFHRGGNAHDRRGFRGEGFPLVKPPGERRVVCLGGSTTYGWGVRGDHRMSFPALLGQKLAAARPPIRVINAGTPGWTSLEVLIDFETRILDLAPDVVLVYLGINDVMPRVVWPPEEYHSDLSGWLRRDQHVRCPPLLERLTLSRIWLVKSGRLESHSSWTWVVGDQPPSSRYFTFLHQRGTGAYPSGVFVDTPIEKILQTNRPVFFERNLRNLVGIAKDRGVRVVLTTFAVSSKFPDRPFVGHPAIRAAVAEHNAILRRIAADTGTPLFDLAAKLPDDASLFTDGCHFTEKGNRLRVDLLLAEKNLLR